MLKNLAKSSDGWFCHFGYITKFGGLGGGEKNPLFLAKLSYDDLATLATSQNWRKQKKNPKTPKPQNPTAAGDAEFTRVY
jgi:hypothetical protein